MMGNLGRATYVNSTENVWPFSTNVCDDRTRNSQKINSCRHSIHVEGMYPRQGRGAPEIDLLEVLFMDEGFDEPVLSTSLQVAPGVFSKKRPEAGYEPNEARNSARALWKHPSLTKTHILPLCFFLT